MACSKVFSGDLPELINGIAQYLQNDYKTLMSCILVNRLWCRLIIPLLWENPFSVIKNFRTNNKQKYRFIEIYLHDLNEDDKIQLKEYGVNYDLFPSNTLFNYPSFIKYFSTEIIIYSIDDWVCDNSDNRILTIEFPLRVDMRSIKGFIFLLLIKTFIKNEASLHVFRLEISNTLRFIGEEHFNNSFELILQNPNLICNVKNLTLYFDGFKEIVTSLKFFKCFYTNSNLISSFYIFNDMNHYSSSNKKDVSQIINSQHNLKKILFHRDFFLFSLKDSNCSNTLKILILYEIDFKNIIIFKEVFEYLNVLEFIHFLYCHSLNSDIIQQIINLTKPFKLKSLFLNENPEILEIGSLHLLLQKTGNYLENIGFSSKINNKLKQQLFDLSKIYCTKIKFLDLHGFDNQIIYSAFDLIKNIKQNLNYLTIDLYKSSQSDLDWEFTLSSIILFNLGQILPYKLEYLSLIFDEFNRSDLEVFLTKSQNTFINKLLIYNRSYQDCNDTLSCIKKYIMKEKRVRYFSMKGFYSYGQIVDLFYFKDKVEEFESYNILVQSYNTLNIQAYNFIA
ncbi:hypothetical protein RclHR1_08990005 [Rhizophagus clarus]|uniref:F-box domain-containing protein n=1 Tax=Rhizophagus clarus TaxID=94130 RepID=A0A2Z6S4Z6_9GLOM|nr:hypothetical protein RclHR1_08990005 [Rhizophagus clarus]GES84951.1 hypothetical protein GLOIN_2v1881105 [Rhizophagus clarus]